MQKFARAGRLFLSNNNNNKRPLQQTLFAQGGVKRAAWRCSALAQRRFSNVVPPTPQTPQTPQAPSQSMAHSVPKSKEKLTGPLKHQIYKANPLVIEELARDKMRVDFQAYNFCRFINIEQLSQTLQGSTECNKSFKIIDATKRTLWLQLIDNENSSIAHEQISKKIDISYLREPPETTATAEEHHATPIVSSENDSFAVVYNYGSIVFFNVNNEDTQRKWLSMLQRMGEPIVSNLLPEVTEDDVVVVVDPAMKEWSKYSNNVFIVNVLDLNNANVIAHVLAKSVALESYEVTVQNILEHFKNLNQVIQSLPHRTFFWPIPTPGRRAYTKVTNNLTPVIAHGNSLRCDLLLSVRIFDTPPECWEWRQYEDVLLTLNKEFEMDDRYQQLERKLDFIHDNTQFYVEFSSSKKSERQEWLIIILIFTEIVIAVLSKMGH